MSKSLVQIYIHGFWSTKFSEPLIIPEWKPYLLVHIQIELEKLNCQLININATPNQIHCLFAICSTYSVSYVIKQIKGSSSRFINLNYSSPIKFEWQARYAAFSVSKFSLIRVNQYIKDLDMSHGFKSMVDP